MKKRLFLLGLVMAFGGMLLSGVGFNCRADEKPLSVLASTFPIYQITRNVTQGRDAVAVSLMIPSQLGCPHDYALTPQDMQKLSKADVLVVNGLGMEEFLGAPVEKANAKLVVVDSSGGVRDLLHYSDMDAHGYAHGHPEAAHDHPKDAGHGHHHHHEGVNPHLFASPRRVGLMTMHVAEALSKIDPAGQGVYFANAKVYAEKMNALAGTLADLGQRLKNNRIVTQHGVFDYLAKDMGLQVVAVVQAHAGQEPSAAEMLGIVETVTREKAGAVFTEPQYPDKIGNTIAREAGIPVAILDPAATGPQNAPLNYYETVMMENLKTLEKTLGAN